MSCLEIHTTFILFTSSLLFALHPLADDTAVRDSNFGGPSHYSLVLKFQIFTDFRVVRISYAKYLSYVKELGA